MAVQAQYSSNLLLPDLGYRVQQQDPGTNDTRNLISLGNGMMPTALEDFQIQPAAMNLLRAYNFGLDSGQSVQRAMDNSGITFNESENDLVSGAKKRPREGDDFLVRAHHLFPVADFQQTKGPSPSGLTPTAGTISTGLRLTLDLNPPSNSTTARDSIPTFSSLLKDELQSQMKQQREEMEELIRLEGERMRQALEEKRQRHTRAILAAIEKGVLKRFKEKETEFDKANRRNAELEERVRQLSLESQLWQNMARNNEVLVSNLRNSLEQVVAQSREQSKEGCGESEVDDAESCYYGEGGDVHARTYRENKEMKEQRTCRICRTNETCILLLPCRHLCLCKECETRLHVCPLCRLPKTASVQVYMS